MRNSFLLGLLMLLAGGVGLLMAWTIGSSPIVRTSAIPVGFLIGYFGWALFTRLGWVHV